MTSRAQWRVSVFLFVLVLLLDQWFGIEATLRFKNVGFFKILQVADMHFGNGTSPCLGISAPTNGSQAGFKDPFCSNTNRTLFEIASSLHYTTPTPGCSDANTSDFLKRLIAAEKPDLIVFTGDNIYGPDAQDAKASMNAAFAPAIESGVPWAAILGNHDQESTLSREEVMTYIVGLKDTVSQVNPQNFSVWSGVPIDGFGNYNLEVMGVEGSEFANKSVLNLFMIDSGDYSKDPDVFGFDWIKPSQSIWLEETSAQLKKEYMGGPNPQATGAPSLAYFHIPLPEMQTVNFSTIVGKHHDLVKSPCVNSGFLSTMISVGDVKAAFASHDHVNDYCARVLGMPLCYGGGFGYHGYSEFGWPRRSRVVVASLVATEYGHKNKSAWGDVAQIETWKILDHANLTMESGNTLIDFEILWSK